MQEMGHELLNTVALTRRTLEEALDERRLALVVDAGGTICSVGASPDALFGWPVASLVSDRLVATPALPRSLTV